MDLQIQLFIREHHNGFFSLEVIGHPDLCIYGPDLEAAREDIMLVLSDRLERTHPRLLYRYASMQEQEHRTFPIRDALLVETAIGEEKVERQISALYSRDRQWQRLWFPRWNSHYWVRVGEDLEEHAEEFLKIHVLKKATSHERLSRRWELREWTEWLELSVETAPIDDFTGKMFGKDMKPLPEVKEKKDDEDEEDKDAEEKEKKKKKKRPPTPTFDRLGVKLSKLARRGELERAYGRSHESKELYTLLQSKGSSSIALVGPAGVGKTNLIYELVHRLRHHSTPKGLRQRPVWFLDASRLVAGEGYFGEWQQQCLNVVQEAIDAEVIWYLGALLPLLDAGKHEGSDQNVSYLLKPYLAGGRLTVIGECNTQQWAQLELRDPGFSRLFTPYRLEEPEDSDRRSILHQVAVDIKDDKDVEVTPQGLGSVLELSQRYQKPDHSLLGESLYFLRRLTDRAELLGMEVVDRTDVVRHFCSETGLPEFLIRDDLPLEPEEVQKTFQSRLIGQDEAISRMVDLISMIKAGLSDLNRPLGSFLFVGPTGVGKTETAKALAQFLFGDSRRMIRFDMSEFLTPDSVHRFLGTARQEGKLVSEIRRTPFCVLLLDEVEKAHSSVFDVLLQVLGEARLTDEAGRSADFRNCVVLMTSNLGVGTIRQGMGFGSSGALQYREHFIAEAERFFRPEFFNRIDSIIPFAALEKDAIDIITRREMSKFYKREGIEQQGLVLQMEEGVLDWIAARGVNPRYGARPLKREIEMQLTAPLARHLSTLKGKHKPAIGVEVEGSALRFSNRALEATDKGRSVARQQLSDLLGEIGEVRFQSHRWSKTGTYRELTQEVKLIGRLSQDRNFWNDRELAEARLKVYSEGNELLKAYTELRDQIGSLEDLAYELYYDRDVEPLETLQSELEDARQQLLELELRLYSRRFEHPNKATLFFQEGKGQSRSVQRFLQTYMMIAAHYGWRWRLYVSEWMAPQVALQERLISTEELGILQRKEEEFQRKKQQALADESEGKSRRKRKEPEHPLAKPRRSRSGLDLNTLEARCWRWKEVDLRETNPRALELPVQEQIQEMASATFVQGVEETPKALVVEGPFVACLFGRETGIHQHISGDMVAQVKVLFENETYLSKEQLVHPLEVRERFHNQRLRVVSENKRTIVDHDLNMNQPLEPRWHNAYHHLMRGHLYFQSFREQGLQWFRRQPRRKLTLPSHLDKHENNEHLESKSEELS